MGLMIFKLSLAIASILLTFGNITANDLHQQLFEGHEVLCNNTSNIIDNNTEVYPQLVNNKEQLLDKNVDVCDNIFTNINKTVSNDNEISLQSDKNNGQQFLNNDTIFTNINKVVSSNNTDEQLSEDNAVLLNKVLNNTSSNNEVNIKSENSNNKSLFNDNAVLCDKIFKEIGKILNTNNVIIQQSCCGQVCNLTMGAYCVAEQLKLASDYLKTDSPDSDIFKEHAKVFNLLLDLLQKKANKSEITTSQFINDRIKLYLNTIVPINI